MRRRDEMQFILLGILSGQRHVCYRKTDDCKLMTLSTFYFLNMSLNLCSIL